MSLNKKGIIEAILFSYAEPISAKEIQSALKDIMEINEVKEILFELKNFYKQNKNGIQILQIENKFQFISNPNYSIYMENILAPKKKKTLTQAALETLAIVAYKQPITKIEIEDIRGVKCDKALKTLLEYDFIKESGRLKKIGNPILYSTSENFLKSFGFESIKELPNLETIKEKEIFDMERKNEIK